MSTMLTTMDSERYRPGSLRHSVRRLFARAAHNRSDSRPGMFDRAQNTRIQHATFTINQYGAVDRPLPVTLAEGQSASDSTAPSARAHEQEPSPRPRRESPDVYVDCLLTKNRGYPLWIPSPNRSLPILNRTLGVSVGDVGVLTAEGGFDFLFNIFHDANHPINAVVGVPDTFVPFSPVPSAADIQRFIEWNAGTFLADVSIVKVPDSSALSNTGTPSSITLEATGAEGAVLMIPEDVYTAKLKITTRLRKYVEKHIAGWYTFVMHTLGHDIDNGDLRVVYGCRKSSGFGIATAFNTGRRENTQLSFLVDGSWADISRCPYRWSHSGSAEVKTGPSGVDNVECLLTEPAINQCLFLNTIDVRVSAEIWKNVELNIVTQFTSGSLTVGEPNSSKHGSTARSGESESTRGPSSLPCYERTFHPSVILHDILETIAPGLPAYIVCDDDWAPFILDTPTNARDFVDQILEHRLIVEEQGILFFCAENDMTLSEQPSEQPVAHIRFSRNNAVENPSHEICSYWQAERCVNSPIGISAKIGPSSLSLDTIPASTLPAHLHAAPNSLSTVAFESNEDAPMVTLSSSVLSSQPSLSLRGDDLVPQLQAQSLATPSAIGVSSSSSTSRPSPYVRRPAQTSLQRLSACGACRMRRVRCDLKELPSDFVGPPPACSNCKERGIKCVDEFADVKGVKLLRRGRLPKQVEAIYSEVSSENDSDSRPHAPSSDLQADGTGTTSENTIGQNLSAPPAMGAPPFSSAPRPSPYARRPANDPKISARQFSTCGACRMRRIRCDWKDLPASTIGPTLAGSNCRERSLKCVDKFADVKAVKLLGRGRRLQQVEAINDKASSGNENDYHPSVPSSDFGTGGTRAIPGNTSVGGIIPPLSSACAPRSEPRGRHSPAWSDTDTAVSEGGHLMANWLIEQERQTFYGPERIEEQEERGETELDGYRAQPIQYRSFGGTTLRPSATMSGPFGGLTAQEGTASEFKGMTSPTLSETGAAVSERELFFGTSSQMGENRGVEEESRQELGKGRAPYHNRYSGMMASNGSNGASDGQEQIFKQDNDATHRMLGLLEISDL